MAKNDSIVSSAVDLGPPILPPPKPKRDLYLRAVVTGILIIVGYIAFLLTDIKQVLINKPLIAPAVQGQNFQPGVKTSVATVANAKQ